MKELAPEEIQKLMQNMVDEFKPVAGAVMLAVCIDEEMVLLSGFGGLSNMCFIGKNVEKMIMDRLAKATTTESGRI